MSGRPQSLTKGQKEEVVRLFRSKILAWILTIFAIVAGTTGLSLWGIKNRLERALEENIANQFEENRIKETLTEVAEGKASQIITDELTPSINDANKKIDTRIGEFQSRLDKFEGSYSDLITQLSEEVEYLKHRSRIIKLGNEALASGKAEFYESLLDVLKYEKNEEYKSIASSEIYKIKTNFATMTRSKGVSVRWTHKASGLEFVDEEIPTEGLIKWLKSAENWKHRSKIAELLRSRKQKSVPEALLESLHNDAYLEVRKNSKKSFGRITGYEVTDVFDPESLKKWWADNQKEVNEGLEELQTIDEFIKEKEEHNQSVDTTPVSAPH